MLNLRLLFFILFTLCCSDWKISIALCSGSLTFKFVHSIVVLRPSMLFLYFFSYCFFVVVVFKFPFDSSLYLLFLAETFYFFNGTLFIICFNHVNNSKLKYFYGAALKYFFRQFKYVCHLGVSTH